MAPKLRPELGVDGVQVFEGRERQADPLIANRSLSEMGFGVVDGRWGEVHDDCRAVREERLGSEEFPHLSTHLPK